MTVPAMQGVDFRLQGRRVWVAGHRGMVGSAVVRRLAAEDCETLTVGRDRLDLRDGAAVERWLAETRPEVVVLAAARVGGILANARQPADFLYDNLAIAGSVIHAAFRQGVAKLLFLGSSCIYPKLAPQPIPETALLTGPLEPTNEGYAIAKIAGIRLCEAYRRQHGCDFISAMPTNLYGPNDNFHPENSHVLPALLRKVHEAKAAGRETVELWGSGRPRREFLHVDDLADACVHLLRHWSDERTVNVGTGTDIAIAELAALIAEVVGWHGRFVYDPTKPDGTPRKLLDVSRLTALGWTARIPLRDGIAATSRWYLENAGELRHG
ncbi:GDP-L-fucose synthase [Rhodospirillum centenum]|uniref:GDP-L-fucose synthase n=1 Tax=Rhodospirillum centenum (strain ATCC 51521 / SW) TaxID=414684 RepID=B6IYJ7_RHOCS|nr:GDP-L-fucose synthase [Rhodospirillum centenum]ACJ01371.1 GDP-L-fucose synthetase [Rhodospirillum centenum SW]